MEATTVDLAQPEVTDLTIPERAELGRYEAVIERNLTGFLEAGRALMAIRDSKLYRTTHGTFEDYCFERWGISRSYGYRMIEAAEVVENLSPIGNILPVNESQTRPLASLEPDQQVAAWKQATEVAGGRPTAAQVQQAADEIKPRYAPVWELESKVREWIVSLRNDEPDLVLDVLKAQADKPIEHGTWIEQLDNFIHATLLCRKSDLIQAINNVREQRRQAKLQAASKVVYVEPKIVQLDDPDYRQLKEAGFVAHMRVEGPNVTWRWAWPQPQLGREYLGEWQPYLSYAGDEALRWYKAHMPPEPAEEQATDPDTEELEAMAAVAVEREEEERERIEIESTPRVTRHSLGEIPPDLKRYGYDIYQLLRAGEEEGHWWYDCGIGGAGAWDSAERAIELARDDLQRRKSVVAGHIVSYLAGDSSGDEFEMALEQAGIEHLQSALGSTRLSKTRRSKIEARIRKLGGGLPTIVAPDAEDLEQEADDLLLGFGRGENRVDESAEAAKTQNQAMTPTVTLTISRKIAQALHAACRNYDLRGFLAKPEQDALEQALWSAFAGKETDA